MTDFRFYTKIHSVKNLQKKTSVKDITIQIVIFVAEIILFASQLYCTRINLHGEIFGMAITASGINGIISQVIILLIIWMYVFVPNSKKLSFALAIFYWLNALMGLVASHSLMPLPGFVIAVGLLMILGIISGYKTRVRKDEVDLEHMAYTDYLTDLPNRRALLQELDRLFAERKAGKNIEDFALVRMEIENFKSINDMLGHDKGDNILQQLSKALMQNKNENCYLARMDGAEFAMIVHNYGSKEAIGLEMEKIAVLMQNVISLTEKKVFAKADFGVAFSDDECDTVALMSRSDIAMSHSRSSAGHVCFFNREMIESLRREAEVNAMIREALKNNTFFVMYQPQFDTKTKKLRGFEALARMRDKNGVIVSPGLFIPAAEKSDLIIDIDRWIFRNALEAFKPLVKNKDTDMTLSVNMSGMHISSDSFVDDINRIVEQVGFPRKNLELEVTESVLIDSLDDVTSKLLELRKGGIRIALDDFGTGYSSLSYLKSLPIDLLKIDKAFVDNIAHRGEEVDFINAIISLGHIMHFSVISEGVEKDDQLEILKQLDCDYIQGFIWGKPLAFDDAKSIIEYR